MRASPHRQPHKMPRISFPSSIDWMPKGKRKTNYTPRPVSAQASCGKTPPHYVPFRFPARRLHTRSAVVVINTHKTAIAQPLDTLPCSNSRLIYVETTKVFGGAMRLAVTSSRKAMMKIIIHPAKMPREIIGSVTRRNTYEGVPPKTRPACKRLSLIWVKAEVTYVHKNKGAFVTIEKSVLMYDMELWPQADYAGTSVSRIAYKVTLWENGKA